IQGGFRGRAPQLTFGDIYPVLRQRLQAKGLPVPSQRGTSAVDAFHFSANAAVPMEPAGLVAAEPLDAHAEPHEDPEPAWPEQSRHAGVVADALRAAQSIAREGTKAQA